MNNYLALKKKHQEEIDNFPFGWAFNKKQFAEMMEKFGLKENETDKLFSIGGGGYILKTDSEKLDSMSDRHSEEMRQAMNNEEFVYQMFSYELSNHEYVVTGDIEDTLNALGLTHNEVMENKILKEGLEKAIRMQSNY